MNSSKYSLSALSVGLMNLFGTVTVGAVFTNYTVSVKDFSTDIELVVFVNLTFHSMDLQL